MSLPPADLVPDLTDEAVDTILARVGLVVWCDGLMRMSAANWRDPERLSLLGHRWTDPAPPVE